MQASRLISIAACALLAACSGTKSDSDQQAAAQDASPSQQTAAAPQVAAAGEVAAPAAAPPAAFAICTTCHAPERGKNGIGPSLAGIVGSSAGDVPGYQFSPALKASGIKWDRKTLDTWLQGPSKMVPGTKMLIQVDDAAKRAQIIDYLETLK